MRGEHAHVYHPMCFLLVCLEECPTMKLRMFIVFALCLADMAANILRVHLWAAFQKVKLVEQD